MRFVTSFGPEGYEVYGRQFLETWDRYCPGELYVYHEGHIPEYESDRIHYQDLFEVPGCQEFLFACQLPAMQGNIMGGKRNYRYDAFRFSRKSFAQFDAASDYDGKLYWLDADIEITDTVSLPLWEGEFMQYLGRPDWHSCASFIGWDCSHDQNEEFWKTYYHLYVTGTVFALNEWHDSFVLDWLRTQMKLSSRNLSEGIEMKGPANVFNEVFSWGSHKKGKLKYAA